MKIIIAPNPILEKISSPVSKINQETKQLADKLIISLANKGIGLAAPQIGKNQTVFIIKLPEEKPQIFINPAIISHSSKEKYFQITDEDSNHHQQTQPFLEGCLSLPSLYGTVKRWSQITARWFDEFGQKHQQTLNELTAIVFQHELDHLRGKLFFQRTIKEGGQLYRKNNEQLKEILAKDIF